MELSAIYPILHRFSFSKTETPKVHYGLCQLVRSSSAGPYHYGLNGAAEESMGHINNVQYQDRPRSVIFLAI